MAVIIITSTTKNISKKIELISGLNTNKSISEKKQEEIYNFLIQNKLYLDEEYEECITSRHRIICKTEEGYRTRVNLDRFQYSIFNYRDPDLSLQNLSLLAKKINLELISTEFIDSSSKYTFIKIENGKQYKIQSTIGNLQKALDKIKNNESIDLLFNKFSKYNDYTLENLDIFLDEFNIKRTSECIEYNNNRRYINGIDKTTLYKYKINIGDLIMRNKIPATFDTSNPFFLYNIQILCNKKQLNIKIDLDQKLESRLKIRAVNKDGMTVILSSEELQRNRPFTPKILHPSYPNDININNIKLWCKNNRPDYMLLSTEYKNAKSHLRWKYIGNEITISNNENKEFTMSWDNFSKYKSPMLFILRKTERTVQDTLLKYNIPFEVQVKLEGCKNKNFLPFDFVIFKSYENKQKFIKEKDFKNILFIIEYQGPQHKKGIYGKTEEEKIKNLEYTKKNDEIKRLFCEDKKIKLEEMNQTTYEDIPTELERILKNTIYLINRVKLF